jgi:hypothetical protein
LGWTGVTYDSSTGQITFTSDDGLDYVTDDLRPSGGGSGISNVVEDTTPQLGGDLDLNSRNITGTGDITINGIITATGEATIDGVDIGTGPGTGNSNTRVGVLALRNLTNGDNNTALGHRSGESTTTQDQNAYVGTFAGLNATGSGNTAVGYSALYSGSAASNNNNNTAIGGQSLNVITSGDNNTAVGKSAGLTLTTGTSNTMVGHTAYSSSATVSHEITLGDGADKSFRIPGSKFYINGGSEGTPGTRVGINTDSPAAQLHVNGDAQVDGTITASSGGSVIPFYFANQAAFPNATTYHGAIAHSHADGTMYFAHGGVWERLAKYSEIGSGGSGTPGGSNTQVQYNNNGSFGGDSTFTFDSATNTLTVQNLTVTGSGATNTISSSSDVVLDAGNRVSVQGAVPFRLPNVTTTQRNAIAGATGDMVFNTTTSAVEVYNGTAWVAL